MTAEAGHEGVREGRDFCRSRKPGLARLLLLLVCWGRGCAWAELCEQAGWDG